MRKRILSVVAVAAVLAAAACSSTSDDNTTTGTTATTITIGEITDLSGGASVYGKPENQGAQIAVAEINAAGGIASLGGSTLAIKTYDTASSVDQAAPQATAAVADKVAAVFGGEISDSVIAGTNITQRAGIPWVDAGGTANDIFNRGYETVFTVDRDSTQYGAALADSIRAAAKALSISNPTVAIAYSDTTYGHQLLDAFNQDTDGLTVVDSFPYAGGTSDFSSTAARLAAEDADVIFNAGYPGDGIALAKLFSGTVTPKASIVVAGGSDATDIITQLGDAANGTILIGDLTPDTKGVPASFVTFYNDYQAKFGTIPNSQALAGFEAVQVIAAGLQAAGSTDPAKLVAGIKTVQLTADSGNIYPSPATLSFAADGSLTEAPFFTAQIQNGKQVLVWPDAVAEGTIVAY